MTRSSNNEVHRIPHPRRVRNPVTSDVRLKMKRKTLGALILLACTGVIVVWHLSQGHTAKTTSDVTQPFELRTTAPVGPFRTGASYVIATGYMDGDATLEITSNNGRDRRTETLSGNFKRRQFGGPEEWVKDLSVRYVPGTARHGEIKLALYCGQNMPRDR